MTIINTSNAAIVDLHTFQPLLICDVWEHAYYLDFQNDREQYVDLFLANINWKHVNENYKLNSIDHIIALME